MKIKHSNTLLYSEESGPAKASSLSNVAKKLNIMLLARGREYMWARNVWFFKRLLPIYE